MYKEIQKGFSGRDPLRGGDGMVGFLQQRCSPPLDHTGQLQIASDRQQ